MRRILFALSLAACNQVYGLDQTRLEIDAGPPPPPTCDGVLAYREQLVQSVIQRCFSYSVATDVDRAVASCGAAPDMFVGEGPIDGELARVPGIVGFSPRMSPEGDRMVLTNLTGSGIGSFTVYQRVGSSWQRAYDLPIPVVGLDDSIGAPSRRPGARILHARPDNGTLDEYIEDTPDNWRLVRAHPQQELGLGTLYSPFNFTPDGLHAVGQSVRTDMPPLGVVAIMHLRRAKIDEPFEKAVPIMGVPRAAFDAFMTADCGRIYFSGLSSIFYAQQR